MGGKGSGGARVGAGRHRKSDAIKQLQGWAGHHPAPAKKSKEAAPKVLPVMAPPVGLPDEQRAIWLELAPFAAAQRTLTPEMALSFRDLCEAIALKRRMLATIEDDGLTFERRHVDVQAKGAESEERIEERDIKAHPLITHHRGLMQRVEAGLMRFRLSPMGKEVDAPAEDAADDPFAEFDGPKVVKFGR